MANFTYSGAAQYFTVTETGRYNVVALGAQGGNGGSKSGGFGASVGATYNLTAGQHLQIFVGGAGASGGNGSGGGGGGTFVFLDASGTGNGAGSGTYTRLLAAGGGGGAYSGGPYGGSAAGGDGTVTQGNGSGGSGAYGAGGSGARGNGQNSNFGNGGSNRSGGYAGGPARYSSGGFGGGGGSGGNYGGGGGGGYTGGSGGNYGGGGGGGSYISKNFGYANSGIPSQTQSGANRGNGSASVTAVCFTTGTRIRIVQNAAEREVAVEALKVGDLAVTASGEHRPITWIGSRVIDCARHTTPEAVRPVRIAAGAFGPGRPARDLLVSPGHAIALDILGEVLIPAIALVNGSTIVQEAVDKITYWHVALDSHDLLVAEGQPAESYLDMGNRTFFADTEIQRLDLMPDPIPAERTHADFCRPFHDHGTLVEVVRSQVRLRAEALGWTLATPEAWADVHLEVDGARVRPKTRGLTATFVLPAEARDVWLVCPTSIPRHVGEGEDGRTLGLSVSGLSLADGFGASKTVKLNDPLLGVGFHDAAPGHRWTTDRAQLPSALLAGLEGNVFLRVDLGRPRLPHWIAPAAAGVETSQDAPRLRLIAA